MNDIFVRNLREHHNETETDDVATFLVKKSVKVSCQAGPTLGFLFIY